MDRDEAAHAGWKYKTGILLHQLLLLFFKTFQLILTLYYKLSVESGALGRPRKAKFTCSQFIDPMTILSLQQRAAAKMMGQVAGQGSVTATEEERDNAEEILKGMDQEAISDRIILEKSAEVLRRSLGQSVSRHDWLVKKAYFTMRQENSQILSLKA